MWSEVDIFLMYKVNLTQKYRVYFKENRRGAAKKYLLIEHIAIFNRDIIARKYHIARSLAFYKVVVV